MATETETIEAEYARFVMAKSGAKETEMELGDIAMAVPTDAFVMAKSGAKATETDARKTETEAKETERELGGIAMAVSTADDDLTPAQQRRVLRRLDWRLVVTISVVYCISIIDRFNMSYASVAGMGVELELTGYRYNMVNLVFFISYVIFELPSSVLVRVVGPRAFLCGIALAWGFVVIGMGFVKSFGQLAGLRLVLGVFEAGFFPGSTYLLSTWYTRYEVGRRYSLFFLVGCVAAACSGILAYGGLAGLSGWRWIFIMEGAVTCALALASYWLIIDFPDSKRAGSGFLSPRERQWLVQRIQRDRGDSFPLPFTMRRFLAGGRDWKVWAYAMLFLNGSTIGFALAYTLPIILVDNMGFNVAQAQCLVAPPYVLAGLVMLLSGHYGDKLRTRGPLFAASTLLCIVGLAVMGWHPRAAVRYFGVFLVTGGLMNCGPTVMTLQANNVRGQWKRAFTSATLVSFGALGGIAGTLVFRHEDKPSGYSPGMYTCLGCALCNLVIMALCDWDIYRQNRLADSGKKRLEAGELGSFLGLAVTWASGTHDETNSVHLHHVLS